MAEVEVLLEPRGHGLTVWPSKIGAVCVSFRPRAGLHQLTFSDQRGHAFILIGYRDPCANGAIYLLGLIGVTDYVLLSLPCAPL